MINMLRKTTSAVISGIIFASCLTLSAQNHALAQNMWGSTTAASTSNGWGWEWNGGGSWPGAGVSNRWMLGVEGANTNLGVSVNRVAAGSAAARAGIAPGDLIVGVGSSRVGSVGERVLDLSDQVNRNADSRGRVEVLVQSRRTMQLSSLFIQLNSATQSAITGQLILPANVRVPPDAVVTVQLDNVSRPHYAVRNGHYSFRPPALTQGAISFTLNYDRSYVFDTDTYQLSAYMTSRGRTVYVTQSPVLVLTRGNPSSVRIPLVPASGIAVASATNVNGANNNVYTTSYTSYDRISQSVTASYRKYLERQPSALELAAWHQVPDVENRLRRLPLELMASQEYFDRVGDNNSVWIQKVFTEIVGRQPTALEFDQWMRRLAELRYSRMQVLTQMQSMSGK